MAWFVILVVIGMIGLSVVQSQFQLTTNSQPPGLSRGDVELRDECLPAKIADWQKQSFTPPKQVVPDGQTFWTHSWIYRCENNSAIVAFDQAAFRGWHELSQCYSAQGWILESRSIHENKSDEWHYVVSEFSKPPNESALVVFSLFFEDGSAVKPPELSINQAIRRNMSWLEQIDDRLDNMKAKPTDPTLQCQAFVPTTGPIDPAVLQQTIQLHLDSRKLFVKEWLLQRSNRSTAQPTLPAALSPTDAE